MQLTKLDRWLRENFVLETHVYSLRPPEVIPPGIHAEDLPEAPGRKYRHHYIARRPDAAEALISQLKIHNQMFTTRVVDRAAWYVPIIAPQGKSVTWWVIWLVLSVVGLFSLWNVVMAMMANPEFRRNLEGAIEVLKG